MFGVRRGCDDTRFVRFINEFIHGLVIAEELPLRSYSCTLSSYPVYGSYPKNTNTIYETPTFSLTTLPLPKAPPSRLIQPERVIPRLQLATYALLGVLVAILVVAAQHLHLFVFATHDRAKYWFSDPADCIGKRLCDGFDAHADGA